MFCFKRGVTHKRGDLEVKLSMPFYMEVFLLRYFAVIGSELALHRAILIRMFPAFPLVYMQKSHVAVSSRKGTVTSKSRSEMSKQTCLVPKCNDHNVHICD